MDVKKFYESVKIFEQQAQPTNATNQPQQQKPVQQQNPATNQPQPKSTPAPAQQQNPAPAPPQPQQTQTQQQANQQATQQKPAAAPTQKPVDQVSVLATKDLNLSPEVALKTGTQATITPGDLSGNVTVQVGDKSYKVNDANIKQLLKTGDLSVVDVAETFSKKIRRLGL